MDNISFEQSMVRIDEIVKAMSGEELTLAHALELFKEATELIILCSKTIDEAELVVEEYKNKLVPEETL